MRIGLLTALAREAEGTARLASRRFLGRSILAHQVDQALGLGCDVILCLVDGIGPPVIEAQHRAEGAGARFQTIADLSALVPLVRAEDEVVVIADGLLPDPDILQAHLSDGPAILTLPSDIAIDRGFERIDAGSAWAGAMLIPGDEVAHLADLPPDFDAASSLVRIGLQSGVACKPLDPAIVEQDRWEIRPRAERLARREGEWIRRHVSVAGFAAPGLAIAQRAGLRLARDLVGRKGQSLPLLVAVASGLAALVAAVWGRPDIGLALALPLAIALPVARIFDRIAQGPVRGWRGVTSSAMLRWGADTLLVAVVALVVMDDIRPEWLGLLVPVFMMGLLHLGERIGPPALRGLMSDRIVLVALLLAGAVFGVLLPGAAGLATLALAAVLAANITTD